AISRRSSGTALALGLALCVPAASGLRTATQRSESCRGDSRSTAQRRLSVSLEALQEVVMSTPAPSIIESRRHQMFPTLAPAEVSRLRRFGVLRSYGAGDPLVRVGETGHGLTVILDGKVEITQRRNSGSREHIVTHETGAFMGELAQLSGRPALVDAHAK